MDNYVREQRVEILRTTVPVNYIPGGISIFRTRGQKWSHDDPFIQRCAEVFCAIHDITMTSPPSVISSFHRNNGFNVVNITTRLTTGAVRAIIFSSANHGSIMLAGRSCSLQETAVFTERDNPRARSFGEFLTPPYQLDSITFVQQDGDYIHYTNANLINHVINIANNFIGLHVTDFHIMPCHNTIAINIYFTEQFTDDEDLFQFILGHPHFNDATGAFIATITIAGRPFSVEPTIMAFHAGHYVNRRDHDRELLARWREAPHLAPRRIRSPQRGLSPRRTSPSRRSPSRRQIQQ